MRDNVVRVFKVVVLILAAVVLAPKALKTVKDLYEKLLTELHKQK